MPLQLPFGEHLNLIANVTITTRPGRHYNIDAISINRIARAFSPKEIPVERQLELLDGFQFQRRMQVDVIGRTDQSGLAEIRATREQRIECFQIAVVWISVAAREVGFETDAR